MREQSSIATCTSYHSSQVSMRALPGDALARAWEMSEPLDLYVQQIARMLKLVALRRLGDSSALLDHESNHEGSTDRREGGILINFDGISFCGLLSRRTRRPPKCI